MNRCGKGNEGGLRMNIDDELLLIHTHQQEIVALRSRVEDMFQHIADTHAKCAVGDVYKGVYVKKITCSKSIYDAKHDKVRMCYQGVKQLKDGSEGKLHVTLYEALMLVEAR